MIASLAVDVVRGGRLLVLTGPLLLCCSFSPGPGPHDAARQKSAAVFDGALSVFVSPEAILHSVRRAVPSQEAYAARIIDQRTAFLARSTSGAKSGAPELC